MLARCLWLTLAMLGLGAVCAQAACPPAPQPADAGPWAIERLRTPHPDVVPVAIHFMRNRACAAAGNETCMQYCPSMSPSCQWTPERVVRQLGRSGLVNEIWSSAAGLRVAVVAVRQCAYDQAQFGGESTDLAPGLPPEAPAQWPSAVSARRYNAVNARFGVPRVLNLFVWLRAQRTASLDITYFGTSPLHPAVTAPKRAIVWADAYCMFESDDPDEQKFSARACARKLAHEIGHALTLRHTLAADGTSAADAQGPTTDNAFAACADQRTDDTGALAHNLMRPGTGEDAVDIENVRLTPWQACQARTATAAFFKPPSR